MDGGGGGGLPCLFVFHETIPVTQQQNNIWTPLHLLFPPSNIFVELPETEFPRKKLLLGDPLSVSQWCLPFMFALLRSKVVIGYAIINVCAYEHITANKRNHFKPLFQARGRSCVNTALQNQQDSEPRLMESSAKT